MDSKCPQNKTEPAKNDSNNGTFTEETTVEPLILIPQQSRDCNEKWSYSSRGKDWECSCKEGKQQSPIDLPKKDSAQETPLKPLFQYKIASKNGDGDEPLSLRYKNNALRVIGKDFGKIITLDGAEFVAQEIVVHTPSEHTIGGSKFDMEVQVVHYGTGDGDLARQVLLCFLFKIKPGVQNKFLDKLNYLDLPNPVDDVRPINDDLFIPYLLQNTDAPDIPGMDQFSFFTYEGSLTAPPCTERTIVIVSSEVLQIASMTVELFKEALRVPDLQKANGNIVVDTNTELSNAREPQERGNRIVYHYNHMGSGIPSMVPAAPAKEDGHYEVVTKAVKEMIFVNGEEPSGIPGSYTITEGMARGTPEPPQAQGVQ